MTSKLNTPDTSAVKVNTSKYDIIYVNWSTYNGGGMNVSNLWLQTIRETKRREEKKH